MENADVGLHLTADRLFARVIVCYPLWLYFSVSCLMSIVQLL